MTKENIVQTLEGLLGYRTGKHVDIVRKSDGQAFEVQAHFDGQYALLHKVQAGAGYDSDYRRNVPFQKIVWDALGTLDDVAEVIAKWGT